MIVIVKVTPNAHKSEVIGFHDDILKVKIQAPPDKGKANDALIKLLSEYYNVSKSQIEIISGHSSRTKKIKIEK